VLKSWAVPRGPSTNPTDKRLAVQTEDHSFDYLDFEGVIGEQRYGSGAVIVWDIGRYRNLNEQDGEPIQMADAIDAGHLKFWLDGLKVTGGYALTRTDDEPRGQWLLVKIRDRAADSRGDLTVSRPESVLSGRTIEDLAAEAGG
jgi:DNA ligase D-like protein (predicted 3'-phosphoesterase)